MIKVHKISRLSANLSEGEIKVMIVSRFVSKNPRYDKLLFKVPFKDTSQSNISKN
jgi:hypothetical protein